jgi:hypothetical protein
MESAKYDHPKVSEKGKEGRKIQLPRRARARKVGNRVVDPH